MPIKPTVLVVSQMGTSNPAPVSPFGKLYSRKHTKSMKCHSTRTPVEQVVAGLLLQRRNHIWFKGHPETQSLFTNVCLLLGRTICQRLICGRFQSSQIRTLGTRACKKFIFSIQLAYKPLVMFCRYSKFCGVSRMGRTIRTARLLPKEPLKKENMERRYTNPSGALW